MSTKTKRKAAPVLYDHEYEKPPPAARLHAMILALTSGAEINGAMRAEIITTLKGVEVRQRNDELRSAKGRDIEYSTWYAAAIAKELIDHRGATKQAAFFAAAQSVKWQRGLDPDPKSVTINECKKIKKAYEKLDKSADGYIATKGQGGGKFKVALISPAWIDDAAARLDGGVGSGTTPAEAHDVIALPHSPLQENHDSSRIPRNK